jgi:peptide/nickel transport system ATP-binding protein
MNVEIRDASRVFSARGRAHRALRGVSLALESGRTLAVVGESGSGKSTLARLVAGLDRPTSGAVLVGGAPPRLRGGRPSPVQMVFQSPSEALNPYRPVGASIAEPLRALPRAERRRRVGALMEQVGLDPGLAGRRPEALSGGQQQRVVIARALAPDPQVLVCDEPTSALDVSVQAQIVNLLLATQEQRRFTLFIVTHDLGVVRVLADEVALLQDGELIEHVVADRFFAAPEHEHARALLRAAA